MSITSKVITFILCVVIIFAWITKDIYGISLLEYIDYSAEMTDEEEDYLKGLGGLVYGVSENNAPLSFSTDGEENGIIVDYIGYLSAALGIKISKEVVKTNDLISPLEDGYIDISDLFPTKQRNQTLDFSQTVYTLRGVLAVRISDTKIEELKDLREKKIIVVKGDYNREIYDKIAGLDVPAVIVYAENIPQALELLNDGKGDAIAGDEMVLDYYIKSMDIDGKFRFLKDELYAKEVAIAVKDDHDILLRILNKGILKLKKDNLLHNLEIEWFGASTKAFKDTREDLWIPIFFAAFFGFSLLLYVWDSILRKQIRLATIEINNQKETLRTIIDTIESSLVVIDKDKKIVESNMATEKVSDLSYGEIIGRDIDSLEIIGDVYKKYLRDRGHTQKHKAKYYSISESSIHSAANARLVLVRDITENVIAERRLRQENKMTAIGQLSAGLAHEIRNPLGLIRNYKFIISEYATDEISQHAVDIIGNSADRINGLIDNLLKFSRLGNEKPVWFDLNNTINNILLLENKKAEALNVVIKVNMENPLVIYSNEETIRLVLFNLINNALEALGRYVTSKQKAIEIAVEREETSLKMSVTDNGAGIAEENLENIFNPFFTTKEGGTGLGLYIVSTELEKVSGSISVSSREDVETVFTVVVPAESEDR